MENELRPIEEIREESKFTEIFKMLDLLNEWNIPYEFYDRSYVIPRPIPMDNFNNLDFNDPRIVRSGFANGYYMMTKVEHYQIIIRKRNSVEPLVSIIQLEGYKDTLEIMSETIYVHDKTALQHGDVEQYLYAEELIKVITDYFIFN